MAASVKGSLIVWGVQDDPRDAALVAMTSGIVTSFSVAKAGATTTISDEQDDVVTRVDHAEESKITIEVLAQSTSTIPDKGDLIDMSGLIILNGDLIIDGIDFSDGSLIVDDAKIDYGFAAAKKISISATYTPTELAEPE